MLHEAPGLPQAAALTSPRGPPALPQGLGQLLRTSWWLHSQLLRLRGFSGPRIHGPLGVSATARVRARAVGATATGRGAVHRAVRSHPVALACARRHPDRRSRPSSVTSPIRSRPSSVTSPRRSRPLVGHVPRRLRAQGPARGGGHPDAPGPVPRPQVPRPGDLRRDLFMVPRPQVPCPGDLRRDSGPEFYSAYLYMVPSPQFPCPGLHNISRTSSLYRGGQRAGGETGGGGGPRRRSAPTRRRAPCPG